VYRILSIHANNHLFIFCTLENNDWTKKKKRHLSSAFFLKAKEYLLNTLNSCIFKSDPSAKEKTRTLHQGSRVHGQEIRQRRLEGSSRGRQEMALDLDSLHLQPLLLMWSHESCFDFTNAPLKDCSAAMHEDKHYRCVILCSFQVPGFLFSICAFIAY